MSTTLVDHLRALSDDGLAALLRLRADLVVPVPADLSALAVRAQSRVSVARALDPLDQFTLEVLDAIRLSRSGADGEETSVEAVLALATAGRPAPDPELVRAAIDRLRALFLVYGPDSALRVAAGVDEVCSPYPAGLGRPAADLDAEAAALCGDPAGLRRTLLAAPPASRAVLERLAGGPPLGTMSTGTNTDPDSPIGWLVTRRLLVPVADHAVELPREVGLLLRRDVGPLGMLHPAPPELSSTGRSPDAVDSAGAGQALEALRNTDALLEALAAEPVPMLRSGGLGIRDLRRLARAIGLDEIATAVLLEVAAAAGLIGETDPDAAGEVRFLPTAGYDDWRSQPLAQRWVRLARGWLLMARQPGLVGRRDERDRSLSVLAPELERSGAPVSRTAALSVLADAGPGAAPPADGILAVLAWRAPRRYSARSAGTGAEGVPPATVDAVRSALSEAALLGVTGLGVLTTYGRLLLADVTDAAGRDPDDDPLGLSPREGDDDWPPVAALAALLPAPVDHVLLQADLTIVVPGPAEPTLAAELAVVADAESANMYRITTQSLRRALDMGYRAEDLHAVFSRRSRTPVPQSLTYLIDDVARRHGGLRVGAAGAYLRSEDEALLTELLVDRRLSDLRLRRLATTVLATPYTSGRLLSALREAGYAPVAEDASGAAVLARPNVRRAHGRRPGPTLRSIVDTPVRLGTPRLFAIAEQLRRADAAARNSRRAPVSLRSVSNGTATQAHTQAMAVLQQAIRDRQRVWVGYVDAHGGTAARLVRPVSIGAGYLRAEDDRTETMHRFVLARITGAVIEQ